MINKKKKLRIAINAQIPAGSGAGGIETVLRVLTLLTQLGGDEEYVFITHPTEPDWLKSLLGERQIIVRAPHPSQYQPTKKEKIKRVLGPLRPLVRGVKNLVAPAPSPENFSIPVSGGFFESLNCDVVHFPYQDYIFCKLPTVYNPHDLQHLHNPEFFAPEEIRRREIVYPAACRAARVVVTASEFVKRDVVQNYGIEKEKVEVVRWSLPEKKPEKFDEKDVVKLLEKYKCPPRPFALYPAMTWEHKNHIRLLEAVARLRERNKLKINIVCTGHKNSFYPHIEKRLRELNLENQIQFTGIVEYKELSLFYRLAQFVIIPTLFEAASAPLFEAWQNGTAAGLFVRNFAAGAGGGRGVFVRSVFRRRNRRRIKTDGDKRRFARKSARQRHATLARFQPRTHGAGVSRRL